MNSVTIIILFVVAMAPSALVYLAMRRRAKRLQINSLQEVADKLKEMESEYDRETQSLKVDHSKAVERINAERDAALIELDAKEAELPTIDLKDDPTPDDIAEAWNTYIEARKDAEQKNSN